MSCEEEDEAGDKIVMETLAGCPAHKTARAEGKMPDREIHGGKLFRLLGGWKRDHHCCPVVCFLLAGTQSQHPGETAV